MAPPLVLSGRRCAGWRKGRTPGATFALHSQPTSDDQPWVQRNATGRAERSGMNVAPGAVRSTKRGGSAVSHRVKAAVGEENYVRLAQIKRDYDPEDVFRGNQIILPAAAEPVAG